MALRSLIQLNGLFESLPGGSKNIHPADLQNLDPPSMEIQDVLASGDNTIVVPSNAIGCIIIFATGSVTTKKLKGDAADTGVVLNKAWWNLITFDSPPPVSFIINSSALDTGKTTTFVFF